MSLALSNKRVRDGARTRLAIEREALRLFAAKGVDGASIKDISAAVGVVDAALYRHFASKEEMAQAIFAQHYGALAQAITTVGWPTASTPIRWTMAMPCTPGQRARISSATCRILASAIAS